MKTKEEILNDISTDTTTKGRVKWMDAEKAMQEYADQTLAEYKSKLKEESQYELWRELYSELYFGEKFFSFLNRNKSKFTIIRTP